MARTAITWTQALPGQATVQPAPQAIDQANGMNLSQPASVYGTFPRVAGASRTVLIVNNTTVSSKVITFRAGANPPSMRAALGDINFTLNASTVYYIDMPDPARCTQADGSFNVDFASGMTGTISAVGMPPPLG